MWGWRVRTSRTRLEAKKRRRRLPTTSASERTPVHRSCRVFSGRIGTSSCSPNNARHRRCRLQRRNHRTASTPAGQTSANTSADVTLQKHASTRQTQPGTCRCSDHKTTSRNSEQYFSRHARPCRKSTSDLCFSIEADPAGWPAAAVIPRLSPPPVDTAGRRSADRLARSTGPDLCRSRSFGQL